jgi:hypothetical protein
MDVDFSGLIKTGITTFSRVQSAKLLKPNVNHIKMVGTRVTGDIKSERLYEMMIGTKTGVFTCSCEDFFYQQLMCKHIIKMLITLGRSGNKASKEILTNFFAAIRRPKEIKPFGHISLHVRELDNLLGGGIPKGVVTVTAGESDIGKSQFIVHAASCANHAAILDIDKYFDDPATRKHYREFLSRARGRKVDIDWISMSDASRPSAYEMMASIGVELGIDRSPTKTQAYCPDAMPLLQSPLADMLRKEKYDMIIYDSVTSALKSVMDYTAEQNFPARANIINKLQSSLDILALHFKCAIILVYHISKKRGEAVGSVSGGQSMFYFSKRIIQVLHPDKFHYEKYGAMCKCFMRRRWPGKADRENAYVMLVKDVGYRDL